MDSIIHRINLLAELLERLGGYDFDKRIGKEIRTLCMEFSERENTLNSKTMKSHIEKALELYKQHGKVTPSLLRKELGIDNYAASYVIDYMKEKKLFKLSVK